MPGQQVRSRILRRTRKFGEKIANAQSPASDRLNVEGQQTKNLVQSAHKKMVQNHRRRCSPSNSTSFVFIELVSFLMLAFTHTVRPVFTLSGLTVPLLILTTTK